MHHDARSQRSPLLLATLLLVALLGGCTRDRYRTRADREAVYLIQEKSVNTPWEVDRAFTIQPDPRSRFFDPTDPDFPTLPPAGPSLYSFRLPAIRPEPVARPEPLPVSPELPGGPLYAPPAPVPDGPEEAPFQQPPRVDVRPAAYFHFFQAGNGGGAGRPAEQGGQPASWRGPDPFADPIQLTMDATSAGAESGIIPAIEVEFWESLPPNCMARILEFAPVRSEYERTFGQAPTADMLDPAPRLTLQDLFELALINSREYQSQKESLYRAALNLSLDRFDYATKFTTTGNGIDTTYTHNRFNGTTVNNLSVPSSLQGNKLLATGGTLLGRFANDILLTFNGPEGFSADVSSELLFNLTQTVFQRDVLLNSLIQSERDLVYAARDFARFRKQFFLDVATAYYSLLRTYRGVEINTQSYFSQVRNFQRGKQEIQAQITRAPEPISVNQFERNVLTARSSVIAACNNVEDSLDSLKVDIGLPTETPINIDLTELQQLTLRDSVEVERERAQRWLIRLAELEKDPANHGEILTAAESLAERLYSWTRMRGQVTSAPANAEELAQLRAAFRLRASRIDAKTRQDQLQEVLDQDPPAPRTLVLLRQIEVIRALQVLVVRQGQLALRRGVPNETLNPLRQQYLQLEERRSSFELRIDEGLESPRELRVQDLLGEASMLVAEYTTLSQNLDQILFGRQVDTIDFQDTLARISQLLQRSSELFSAASGGLPPIEISADEAMLTALIQRLDLMNERGALADRWREIKIAADELKSFLNLNASQTIRNEKNRPFDLSFENSQTRLGLSLDLPLNRKAQRNAYRRALINYNSAWRNLMEFEDRIKQQVRRELRNLDEARVQYPIFVTQAALAKEQVLSSQLQLARGFPGVSSLDLIDAFDASRDALGRVADQRIGYIILRAEFAFTLEVLMLDDSGFWPEIDNEDYQLQPNTTFPWNAGSAYGTFPSFLKVSHELRRMLDYPPPGGDPRSLPSAQMAVPQDAPPAQMAVPQAGPPAPEQ